MQQFFESLFNFGNVMITIGRGIMELNATITAAFPLYGLFKWITLIASGVLFIKKNCFKTLPPSIGGFFLFAVFNRQSTVIYLRHLLA